MVVTFAGLSLGGIVRIIHPPDPEEFTPFFGAMLVYAGAGKSFGHSPKRNAAAPQPKPNAKCDTESRFLRVGCVDVHSASESALSRSCRRFPRTYHARVAVTTRRPRSKRGLGGPVNFHPSQVTGG